MHILSGRFRPKLEFLVFQKGRNLFVLFLSGGCRPQSERLVFLEGLDETNFRYVGKFVTGLGMASRDDSIMILHGLGWGRKQFQQNNKEYSVHRVSIFGSNTIPNES